MENITDYSLSTNSLDSLIERVSKMTEILPYLKSLHCQSRIGTFGTPSIDIDLHGDLGGQVRAILTEAIANDRLVDIYGEAETFHLKCHYPNGGVNQKQRDGSYKFLTSYYIQISNKASEEFGEKMRSGYYGKLD